MSNWDNEGTYFTLGILLPDIDNYNKTIQGKAPNKYKDIPILTEYHTSSGSDEEDPTDEQIHRSPISLSTTVQAISSAPCPIEEHNPTMLITMAITTQIQSCTTAGGVGPSGGGGPPGGEGPHRGGGAPGGGGPGKGGNNQPITQPDGKPMGMLLIIFEGDCSKAESFL